MAAVAKYLLDTSVLARQLKPPVYARISPMSDRGVLGICSMSVMEMLTSSRSEQDAAVWLELSREFERLPMPDDVWDRAITVQSRLVPKSLHRIVKLPDLLIAATAERHGVTVLHYDRDFDRIAEVTGQPTEWVVPPGEADLHSPAPPCPSAASRWAFVVSGHSRRRSQMRVKPRSSATAACSLSREAKA
jgi:predicted nucleic acid-binding protein